MELVPGQFVSYFLDRGTSDASVAMRLDVVEHIPNKGFLVIGTAREGAAVTRNFFGVPEAADEPAKALGAELVDEAGDADPAAHAPLFLELLALRGPARSAALAGQAAIPVKLPCGIREVTRIEEPEPEAGSVRRHDLCQRVPITGVARSLIFDGPQPRPLTVTAFGCREAEARAPGSYEDFVDLTHIRTVRRAGYSIKHPVTWFLNDFNPDSLSEPWTGAARAVIGGLSCSLDFLIATFEGEHKQGLEICQRQLELAQAGPAPKAKRLIAARFDPSGIGRLFGFRWAKEETEELSFTAIAAVPGGTRAAMVGLKLRVLKANPRRAKVLAACQKMLPKILASFRFL